MATKTIEFNQALFMEEVQKDECLYNRLLEDYNRLNS